MPSVSIVGVGRVGGALAIALSRAGFEIEYLIHRDPGIAKAISKLLPAGVQLAPWGPSIPQLASDILFITTPDPEITSVANVLADRLKPRTVVVHTSGSLSSECLSVLSGVGHATASMHPLVSVSDAVTGAENFADAYFCIEGDARATSVVESVVEAIDGRAFSIDTARKPLYHAAAVMACGHVVALIDMAVEMLAACGVERASAQQILMPLIASTIKNLGSHSPAEALTGSFARLDKDAVQRHLDSMDGYVTDSIRDVYLLLGDRSVDLVEGIETPGSGDALRKVISMAKRKSG